MRSPGVLLVLLSSGLVTLAACGTDGGAMSGDGGNIDAGADAAVVGCEPPAVVPTTCNGHESLCTRGFDQIAYPTTHNAFNNEEERFGGPNQRYSVSRQLADGVRGLMLDTYEFRGEITLCHGECIDFLGFKPLIATLVEIREFLRCHPGEVVSIIFESYVTAEQIRQQFVDSGLIDYVHAQPPGAPWPTLAEMIAANQRLVAFTDREGGAFDWYHDVWEYARETPYAASEPAAFTCTGGRGPLSGGLLIFNHFLTRVIGRPDLAEMVNHNPYFIDRTSQCHTELMQFPNFITVDFYDTGDLFAVVDTLNQISPGARVHKND